MTVLMAFNNCNLLFNWFQISGVINLLFNWFQIGGGKAGTGSSREILTLIDSIKKQITADRFSSIKVI